MDIISKRGAHEPAPLEGGSTPPDQSIKAVPPANPRKDGEYYDTCPNDGCIEVDRSFKCGGTVGHDAGTEEYLDWSMFSADQRKGGCGTLWARTTRQGQDIHDARGMGQAKWLTRSAQRMLSMPSERYQRNYDQVDWSKKPPEGSLFAGGALQ